MPFFRNLPEIFLSHAVDYYFAPQSPWTYLGHERFRALVEASGATVRLRPMDLGAVFAASGGLPLGQRAAQRQAYRLVELARFSKALDVPMNIQPKFFPVPTTVAARLIIAVDTRDGWRAALALSGALSTAMWAQERDISDVDVLAAILVECGLPAERLQHAADAEVARLQEGYTQQALDAGVFGAPSYVVDGEIFWGQDRLDFVRAALAVPTAA